MDSNLALEEAGLTELERANATIELLQAELAEYRRRLANVKRCQCQNLPPCYFLALPPELIMSILDFCKQRTLVRLALTCRKLRGPATSALYQSPAVNCTSWELLLERLGSEQAHRRMRELTLRNASPQALSQLSELDMTTLAHMQLRFPAPATAIDLHSVFSLLKGASCNLRSLRLLRISLDIDPEQIASLAAHPFANLTYLEMRSTVSFASITGDRLAAFIPNLRSLKLVATEFVSSTGVTFLSACPNLVHLDLQSDMGTVSPETVTPVFRRLKTLRLVSQDDHIARFFPKPLKHLESLHVSLFDGSDATWLCNALRSKHFPSLTGLGVGGECDDEGFEECVAMASKVGFVMIEAFKDYEAAQWEGVRASRA